MIFVSMYWHSLPKIDLGVELLKGNAWNLEASEHAGKMENIQVIFKLI